MKLKAGQVDGTQGPSEELPGQPQGPPRALGGYLAGQPTMSTSGVLGEAHSSVPPLPTGASSACTSGLHQDLLWRVPRACMQGLLWEVHRACKQELLRRVHRACVQGLLREVHRACKQELLRRVHRAYKQGCLPRRDRVYMQDPVCRQQLRPLGLCLCRFHKVEKNQ